MPESDALMAATITLRSVDSCFMRLNVTITDSETPVRFTLSFSPTTNMPVHKTNNLCYTTEFSVEVIFIVIHKICPSCSRNNATQNENMTHVDNRKSTTHNLTTTLSIIKKFRTPFSSGTQVGAHLALWSHWAHMWINAKSVTVVVVVVVCIRSHSWSARQRYHRLQSVV